MTIVKTTLIAVLLAGTGAVAGETTTPAAPTDATADPVVAEDARPVRLKACEPAAGSRIRPSLASGCRSLSTPLRIYTQEDIQRTGEIDLNQALRKLDPIFH